MRAIVVDGGEAPFAAARGFISAIGGLEPHIAYVARFVTHEEPSSDQASLNDLQPLKGQLRFRGTDRCLAELRVLGWHLASTFPEGITVEHRGRVNDADEAFLRALIQHAGGALRVTYSHGNAVADDPETKTLLDDRDWIASHFSGDPTEVEWSGLRRRAARYLRCGDSWSVRWLMEELLRHPVVLPAGVAHLIGLSYQMQGLSGQAELYYRRAADGEGSGVDSGIDSLAMLYARHHPAAIRDLGRAEQLLLKAIERHPRQPDAGRDDALGFALRHNALALVHMRAGRIDEAKANMAAALALLSSETEHDHARAILLNNLGRLQQAAGDPAAEIEQAFRAATELDPHFPEYWLDLAYQLAKGADVGAALRAARRADELTRLIAEIPALIGFLHATEGDHVRAAEQYLRAAERTDDPTDVLLETARQWCAAEIYPSAAEALARLAPLPDSDERAADIALLRLEITANLERWSEQTLAREVHQLATRFPSSDLVAANVAALGAGPG